MRRVLLIPVCAAAVTLGIASPALAGSPHFVGTPTFSISGNTLTVSAKEAGLGNEPQIVVVLSGTAECINGGGNHPRAANKTSFNKTSTEPVQNGKANYTLSVTAMFVPSCSPPMTVEFTSATLTDATNGLSVNLIH